MILLRRYPRLFVTLYGLLGGAAVALVHRFQGG